MAKAPSAAPRGIPLGMPLDDEPAGMPAPRAAPVAEQPPVAEPPGELGDADGPSFTSLAAAEAAMAARERELAAREADIAAREAAIARAPAAPIAGTPDAEALRNSAALGPSAVGAPVGMPKLARIILEETENMAPTGQTFAVNGKAFLIVPGVEVSVPLYILEVIDNAMEARPIHDPQTQKVIGYRPRHRFPYRRLPDRAA